MCASSLFRIWRNQLYSPSRKATDGRQQPAARAPEVLKKKNKEGAPFFLLSCAGFFFSSSVWHDPRKYITEALVS